MISFEILRTEQFKNIKMNYLKKLLIKWNLFIKILPFLIIVLVLKLIVHYNNWELMELNSLFTSLVAATIFLIGFLISGVLTDYKESERMPSELTASLKNLRDDAYTLSKIKEGSAAAAAAADLLEYQTTVAFKIKAWLYKEISNEEILELISGMNIFFIRLDQEGIPANYIIKLKSEQNNLRKIILRVETIRATDFIGSAYAIVESMGFIIALGLIFINIDSAAGKIFSELFFTLMVAFLIFYMVALIKDIDDPFDYKANGETGSEINLDLFNDHLKSLK